MRRLITTLLSVLPLLFATSCGGADTHAKAASDSAAAMEEFADLLEGVTDKASAEAAKSDLEKLAEKMKAIEERMNALGDPSEEQLAELTKSEGMDEIMGKLMGEMMRLSTNPEAMAVLQDTMQKMDPGS